MNNTTDKLNPVEEQASAVTELFQTISGNHGLQLF